MSNFEDLENWGLDVPEVAVSTKTESATVNEAAKEKLLAEDDEPQVEYSIERNDSAIEIVGEQRRFAFGWLVPVVFTLALIGGLTWFLVQREGAAVAADGSSDSEIGESDSDETSGLAATSEISEVATLNLDLIAGVGDPTNSGTATLELNSVTGEICYSLNTDSFAGPSRAHIHMGGSDVVGGDIVLELDSQPSYPALGCVSEDAGQVASVLANPGGFYLEMHSPENVDGEETDSIRAQLGQEVAPTSVSQDFFDPINGDAESVLVDGKLIISGNVADQETLDLLLATYEGIDLGELDVVNEIQIVEGSPKPKGTITVRDSIWFDSNSAELEAFDGTVLEDIVTILEGKPTWGVSIIGHTDNIGTDVSNLELSKQRADAVQSAFESVGLDAERFDTRGAGFRDPVATNETEEGRALNRRITFEITHD